jgi:hypothetical protein
MSAAAALQLALTTDGEIAAINLESARRHAWARFLQNPALPRVAESIVDMEQLALQFTGDVQSLDRLEILAVRFVEVDVSHRVALIQAEVASAGHCFADARAHLARAASLGAPREDIERQMLAVDQACGVALHSVLEARRRIAASGRIEDLVPLAALLADLAFFEEADAVYRRALQDYDGASPFPPAWACFQLGMLWGELAPEPDLDLAATRYCRALGYLPGYVHTRVHLAEIDASQGRLLEAEALLRPALASGDPEAPWRLSEVLSAQGRWEEAATHLDAARAGFETLMAKHPLAFADHAAEFYAGSGNNLARALELAQANAANRPTRRALRQVEEIAARI